MSTERVTESERDAKCKWWKTFSFCLQIYREKATTKKVKTDRQTDRQTDREENRKHRERNGYGDMQENLKKEKLGRNRHRQRDGEMRRFERREKDRTQRRRRRERERERERERIDMACLQAEEASGSFW